MTEVYNSSTILSNSDGSTGLGRLRPFETVHTASDKTEYLNTIGLFGTAGDPEHVYDWRGDVMPRINEGLASKGLENVGIFNPLKAEWQPEDAAVEAQHLARDSTLILPVLDLTTGHASLAETGFAALGGTLRPQRVHMYIESGNDYDDSVKRARSLTSIIAQKTLKDFPVNAKMAQDLESLVDNGIRDVADFATSVQSRVKQESSYSIERRTDLNPGIALVGSGARRYDDSWYEGITSRLNNNDVESSEVYSAYVKNWSFDDAMVELEHKTNDAVVLFTATESESSFGAMGELGWLVTYCVLNGQKLGVYVEKHDSEPKSDQNRQRKLAMSHLGRQLMDFPDLPVFVASSPAELARYGASELAKYKQLKKAASSAQLRSAK